MAWVETSTTDDSGDEAGTRWSEARIRRTADRLIRDAEAIAATSTPLRQRRSPVGIPVLVARLWMMALSWLVGVWALMAGWELLAVVACIGHAVGMVMVLSVLESEDL